MTPQQAKVALRLYKRYKTDTLAYRQLAESLGICTATLNRWCWYMSRNLPIPASGRDT